MRGGSVGAAPSGRGCRRGLAWVGLALMASTSAPACGDLTSGGAGELELAVVGDSLPAGPVAAALEGELTLHLQIFIERGSEEIELTEGVQELTLPLGGGEPVLLLRRELPAGRYGGGRVVFRKVEAEVLGGLEVGGLPYEGRAVVELGPEGRVGVTWSDELHLTERETRRIVLEMRASRWLRLLDREDGEVSREEFQTASPRVRVGP